MARFLAIAAVLGTTLALATSTEAGPNKGSSGHSSSHSTYQGSRSSHSYSSHYRGWSSWRWDAHHRCYFYYCPTASCYYYWYAPGSCYYPVSYLAQYPPTPVSYQPSSPGVAPVPVQVSTPIQVTNTNVNTLANGATVPPVAPLPLAKAP